MAELNSRPGVCYHHHIAVCYDGWTLEAQSSMAKNGIAVSMTAEV